MNQPGTAAISITKSAEKFSVTVQVIASFAWQHLKAATLFRDQVERLELENAGQPLGAFFEEIRSYASACLMSTAASLEALINELFIAPGLALRPKLADFEEDFWGRRGIERKPILDKYQRALAMLFQEQLDRQSPQYRDAWALIELRNALVHYKPTWDPDRKQQVALVELLDGKFPLSPFPDAGADFVTLKCMGSGCCRWALSTAFAFLHEFDARAQLDPNKMADFWKLES